MLCRETGLTGHSVADPGPGIRISGEEEWGEEGGGDSAVVSCHVCLAGGREAGLNSKDLGEALLTRIQDLILSSEVSDNIPASSMAGGDPYQSLEVQEGPTWQGGVVACLDEGHTCAVQLGAYHQQESDMPEERKGMEAASGLSVEVDLMKPSQLLLEGEEAEGLHGRVEKEQIDLLAAPLEAEIVAQKEQLVSQ